MNVCATTNGERSVTCACAEIMWVAAPPDELAALVTILRPWPSVRMPRPSDAMKYPLGIRGLELMPRLAAGCGRWIPQRDGAHLGVIVVRDQRGARSRRSPEQKGSGAPAM